jgi:hypothetical protein
MLKEGSTLYTNHHQKFSAISDGLRKKSKNFISIYWNVLTIFRWTITNFILTALREFNYMQI